MFQASDYEINDDFLGDTFGTLNNNESDIEKMEHKKGCSETVTSPESTQPNDVLPEKNKKTEDVTLKEHIFLVPKLVPIKKTISPVDKKVVQRKFPGPGGLSPAHVQLNTSFKSKSVCDKSNASKEGLNVCSQLTMNAFKSAPWKKMLSEYGYLPLIYNISWFKDKLSKKLIGYRIPFLAGMLKTIDLDKMTVIHDPSGYIHGTFMPELSEMYGSVLKPGSTIVLKTVACLSTKKQLYLTISPNNLVVIYNNAVNGSNNVEVTTLQRMSLLKFEKIISIEIGPIAQLDYPNQTKANHLYQKYALGYRHFKRQTDSIIKGALSRKRTAPQHLRFTVKNINKPIKKPQLASLNGNHDSDNNNCHNKIGVQTKGISLVDKHGNNVNEAPNDRNVPTMQRQNDDNGNHRSDENEVGDVKTPTVIVVAEKSTPNDGIQTNDVVKDMLNNMFEEININKLFDDFH